MKTIKQIMVRTGLAIGTGLAAASANATSVLDAAAKTAITTGFTDMKDTALDVLSTSWPFILGIMAIMFGPKIVKRLAKSV
ncbi:putative membrane protein [Burkholderia thailandensis E444]|uniref:hypothetical protein n=1 Tax=Burkholderia thailandensis TaxID=57975 RepID=UPI0003ECA4A8|nr:hypothetical protein [Burkholderia thailandensis]AHI80196.1 putative membrane protein [Burkholderia thailandensis E444]AWY68327.1 hypothetical protein A8H36_25685 [Burkholderia thailandensis]